MSQKVLKVGSSAAVTIPKRLLEKLGLSVGDIVEVDGNSEQGIVTIRPKVSQVKRQEKIAQLTQNFISRYRKDLEALADK